MWIMGSIGEMEVNDETSVSPLSILISVVDEREVPDRRSLLRRNFGKLSLNEKGMDPEPFGLRGM